MEHQHFTNGAALLPGSGGIMTSFLALLQPRLLLHKGLTYLTVDPK